MTIVSIFLGQVRVPSGSTITTNLGSASLTAGLYHLDSGGSDSLLVNLSTVLTAIGHAGATVYLDNSGRIHIDATGAFTLNWANTTQRAWFGYTGNLLSATTHTSTTVSTLWWNPLYPAQRTSRMNVGTSDSSIEGYSVGDTYMVSSPSGLTSTATTHYTRTYEEISFETVHVDQLWDGATSSAGTYQRFIDQVLRNGCSFYHIPNFPYVSGGTTQVDIFGDYVSLGPYKLREIASINNWYQRTLANADLWAPVSLSVQVVS